MRSFFEAVKHSFVVRQRALDLLVLASLWSCMVVVEVFLLNLLQNMERSLEHFGRVYDVPGNFVKILILGLRALSGGGNVSWATLFVCSNQISAVPYLIIE